MDDVLSAALGVSKPQAQKILREYEGRALGSETRPKVKVRRKAHKLPTDTGPFQPQHIKYLRQRNFNPKHLEQVWQLLGTGPMSKLDTSDYKHRILAPIHWKGERVSFQARDITGRRDIKYKACPKDRELVEHQTILYGKLEKKRPLGIIVEGITDVWRLGKIAAGTFGIDFTQKQVRQISKYFKRVVILYDDEPQAQRQAEKLQHELAMRQTESFIETIENDPGALSQRKANALVKKFVKLYYE
jgi:hypothetical protein